MAGSQPVVGAEISIDLRQRLGNKTDHELLVEMAARLAQISELPETQREGPDSIAPGDGAAIRSIGSGVVNRWQARQSFRVKHIIVTADAAVTFDLRIGATEYGPFSVIAGVSYIVLPLYVQGGSEVEIANGTAAALITAFLVGSYVQ
jgi:hypothetical protein